MSDHDAAEIMNRYSSLKESYESLGDTISLSAISDTINDITENVTGLPSEIQKLRQRKYVFASYLENKAKVLSTRWDAMSQHIQRAVNAENLRLRQVYKKLHDELDEVDQHKSNPRALQKAIENLEGEMSEATSSVESAEERIRSQYSTLESDISQTHTQISEITWYLDQRDEASFQFLANEAVFLTSKAEFVASGNARQDPDGILYLTDQRLIFEQKETTGKTLGIFGGKKTQELEWEVPLNLIEKVEAENKGFFGGKDMLHFTLKSGAPFAKITVEVKGNSYCKFWAAQIQRMAAGETKDERAIQADSETLQAIKNAPSACHVCSATLPQLAAGQNQIACEYCGSVVEF